MQVKGSQPDRYAEGASGVAAGHVVGTKPAAGNDQYGAGSASEQPIDLGLHVLDAYEVVAASLSSAVVANHTAATAASGLDMYPEALTAVVRWPLWAPLQFSLLFARHGIDATHALCRGWNMCNSV